MLQLAHRLLLFSWLFRTRAGPEPIEPQEGGEREEKKGGGKVGIRPRLPWFEGKRSLGVTTMPHPDHAVTAIGNRVPLFSVNYTNAKKKLALRPCVSFFLNLGKPRWELLGGAL